MIKTVGPSFGVPEAKFFDYNQGAWKKGQPRQFRAKVDFEDHAHIRYILEHLSSKSLVKILRHSFEIKKRGVKVEHVHPLTFFIAVLSHDCIHHFYQLRANKGVPFDKFTKGALDSFHEEYRKGNITDHQLEVFAKVTKRNLKRIRAFAQSQDWVGLMNWL